MLDLSMILGLSLCAMTIGALVVLYLGLEFAEWLLNTNYYLIPLVLFIIYIDYAY